MRKTVVGVMGAGESATAQDVSDAHALGGLIARNGWVVLTGGARLGVMEAANRGAREAGGFTIGIIPDVSAELVLEEVGLAIRTGMLFARRSTSILSSDAVVACGMAAGTASEIATALKAGKPTLLLRPDEVTRAFFTRMDSGNLHFVKTPEEAVAVLARLLG